MKTVCDLDLCAGCMACVESCPRGAVEIVDSLRSYNAVIDEDRCIGCDLCHSVCQVNNKADFHEPYMWKQGWAADDRIRNHSSSGGIAAALMEGFVKNGGIVCSCTFEHGGFVFDFGETSDEIKKFVGSKYVKSNPIGIYKKIKRRLLNGEKILFIGLPCQVAALKNYIGDKVDENLYTVDLICHGSPSPRILDMFLEKYGFSLEKIDDIRFRKKTSFRLYNGYESILPERVQDNYTFAFLTSLDYTENCYKCKYARKERVSDITLGDSWGSELDSAEQSKGVSLVLCQSDKGHMLLNSAMIHLEDVNIEKSLESNHQLRHPSNAPVERDSFFKYLENGMSFDKAIAKCYPKIYYKQKIKEILIKANILRGAMKR